MMAFIKNITGKMYAHFRRPKSAQNVIRGRRGDGEGKIKIMKIAQENTITAREATVWGVGASLLCPEQGQRGRGPGHLSRGTRGGAGPARRGLLAGREAVARPKPPVCAGKRGAWGPGGVRGVKAPRRGRPAQVPRSLASWGQGCGGGGLRLGPRNRAPPEDDAVDAGAFPQDREQTPTAQGRQGPCPEP